MLCVCKQAGVGEVDQLSLRGDLGVLDEEAPLLANSPAGFPDPEDKWVRAIRQVRRIDRVVASFVAARRHEPVIHQDLHARRLAQKDDQGRSFEAIGIRASVELRRKSETHYPPAAGEVGTGGPEQAARITMAPCIDLGDEIVEDKAQIRSN